MRTLTWDDVWARRLAAHALRERAPAADLAGVVGRICGVQAQVMPAAEVAIGVRVDGVTRRTVQAALWEQRTLVKAFGIRGTIHLFPAEELAFWTAALRAAAEASERRRPSRLVAEQRADLRRAFAAALVGRPLTLQDLGAAVVRHAGAWAGVEDVEVWGGTWPRWRLALGDAALAGLLVYGPPEGNRVTYVRPEDWLGPQPAVDPETALTEVFRRYLRAYGPATARDFAQWFYLPPADARALAARLAAEVEPVDVEGHRALLLRDAGAAAPPLPADGAPRLLPHFDSYVIGCFPRDELVTDAWRARVPPRTTPSQFPELLIAGRVAGLWERQGRGAAITVGVEPLLPLPPGAEAVLAAEAARIGTVLEAESAALALGPVAARPHL